VRFCFAVEREILEEALERFARSWRDLVASGDERGGV
jgi:hypothetical protein